MFRSKSNRFGQAKNDPKMAQKGCDRDSSHDENPKMAHLLYAYELVHFGVSDYEFM